MTVRLGVDAANAAATAVGARLNSGYLRIYSGAPPNSSADGALTNQVLLAETPFAATAFEQAANGVVQANVMIEVTCIATGTAAWFRAVRSDGTTVAFDGSVDVANADMLVSNTSFVANQALQVTAASFDFPLT
jgi:hypothetical protein